MEIAHRRLRHQHLVGVPFGKPQDVVRWFGAVQAQDYAGAKWALGQRTRRNADVDVEQALQAGSILRTHVLRPTWHFVMPADIRWMLRLTAPRIKLALAYYDRQLELDKPTLARCNSVLASALRDGKHLTRVELGRALANAGIAAAGQRLAHIMMHAELDALVCSGPRRGKQFTYALLDERVPAAKQLPREAALAELTRRYFLSHGPALAQDFAWWSGLTSADVSTGLKLVESELGHESIDGKSYWFDPTVSTARIKSPVVHLLPNYDEHVVAYKDHSASFEQRFVAPKGPLEQFLRHHIVAMDGRVIGGWRRALGGDAVTLELMLFARSQAAAERNALGKAAARYAAFLGVPVTVER